MKDHIFGIFPCLAAIRANRRRIYKVVVRDALSKTSKVSKSDNIDDIVSMARQKGLLVEYKSKGYLDKIVGNRPHQNVVMKVSELDYEKMEKCDVWNNNSQRNPPHFWIALDQIQDPMNLGAILRTAGYFGVSGVIASSKNSCRLSPVVSKASAGTMEWLKIYGSEDLPMHLNHLSETGWDVIGSTMPDEDRNNVPVIACDEIILNKPTILVLGNEGMGIRNEVLDCCTKLTTIKSTSKSQMQDLDSLNVSVATGILIHSLLKSFRSMCP